MIVEILVDQSELLKFDRTSDCNLTPRYMLKAKLYSRYKNKSEDENPDQEMIFVMTRHSRQRKMN